MPEKVTREKSKKDAAAQKPIKASVAKGKKEEPSDQVKAKARARAPRRQQIPGKAEDTSHTSKLITFSFEAPQASNVSLAGCFNGWNPQTTPLKQNQEGIWTCVVSVEPGEHQYRFVVDGEWTDDPVNVNRCWNEFGTENCLLIVED